MRFDVARDARSCLGCGRTCSEPYSFCGKCLSDSYFAARPGLSPRMRNIVFWIGVFGVGALSYWLTTVLLHV
jgi:hypothetical protein